MSDLPAFAALMIRANDVDRVARFYAEVLGVSMDLQQDGGRYGELEMAGGTVRFGVVPRPENMPQGAPTLAITWRVVDLADCVERLADLGVTVRSLLSDETGSYVFLRDPEGNEVGLFEPESAGSVDGGGAGQNKAD
ncbi:MAG: putative enzyme related to lactoylglutathione lyase [Myxococcota bacterium]|jgi:predicted enzyme related to lactoylglutathione lyase